MSQPKSGPIAVIGAGLGGLASACTLAARGYEVVLFDKNDWLGGKAVSLEAEGYRFDMGPTILLMPSVIARIFAEAGRDYREALELIPLDPQWRSFFEDGTTLDLVADRARMAERLASFAPESGSDVGYTGFLNLSDQLSEISDKYFFWRSVGGLRDMFDFKEAMKPGILKDLMAMRPWSTVGKTVRSFVPEARVSQMLDHFTQYVGSAPDLSPAVLCGIARMQTGEGVWYPRGGTRAVPVALANLARDLGVDLRPNTPIRSIERDARGGVAAVLTDDGERIEVAAVVSNEDSVRTHRELLAGTNVAARFEKRRGYEPACSGVVLYLGLNRKYDQLLHHNFVFSRDPEEEFDAIYREGVPAPDPTCYVCAPSVTEPEVAPPGGEALYVLVHTPYLRDGQNWKVMLPTYRRVILDKLKKTAGMDDIEDRIRFESWLTPQDIHDRYRVLNGAIYGLASHGKLNGAFKPANRSPDVERLYLAGGSAHPGPGMPMVMMSGWIAADTLDRDGLVARAGSRQFLGSGVA